MILDSTFLVDFERERRCQVEGPAMAFLQEHSAVNFAITFTIAGELAAGRSLGTNRRRWEAFIHPFRLLGYSREVGWQFGRVYRELQEQGSLIGANDLWIAATALANNTALVTRNARDFSRISDLDVRSY